MSQFRRYFVQEGNYHWGFKNYADRLLQTLSLATARNKQYGDIGSSVKGVIFFGTPHRGSASADLPTIVLNVLNAMGGRDDLIKYLQRSSKELAEIAVTSCEQLQDLKVISAYETEGMPPIGVSYSTSMIFLSNLLIQCMLDYS